MSVDWKVLTIDFDLHGEAVSTGAYAIFSLPHGIRVVTDDSVYPPGWECQPVLDDSRLECVTPSVDRDSLHFALHIVVDDKTVPLSFSVLVCTNFRTRLHNSSTPTSTLAAVPYGEP
jgi:hypothetical protein